MKAMRYAVCAVLALGLIGCAPGPESDLSWLADIDTDNSAPVPCYETVTLAAEPPREERIKTPCPDQITPELVKSLQRALAARGIYDGPVTGVYGKQTAAAVETYQAARGLPSSVLSLASARELGLIAYPRPDSLTAPSPEPVE